jgi:hypothetical protein
MTLFIEAAFLADSAAFFARNEVCCSRATQAGKTKFLLCIC